MQAASGLLIDGVVTSGTYPNQAAINVENNGPYTSWNVGLHFGQNGSASQPGIAVATIDDHTSSPTVFLIGNQHTHFYSPDTTTSGLTASYTGTMWHSELTVGGSDLSGTILSLQNAVATCLHTPITSSETVACSSDIIWKTDIAPPSAALPYFRSIVLHDYTIKSNGQRYYDGPIAQELEVSRPEMVHVGPDGTLLADEPAIWRVVEAIKELDDDHQATAAQIAALKALSRRQQSQIAALSSGAARGTAAPANDNGVLGFFRRLIAR